MTIDKIAVARKIAEIAAGSTNPRLAAAGRAVAKAAADPQAQEIGAQVWERAVHLATRIQRGRDTGTSATTGAE